MAKNTNTHGYIGTSPSQQLKNSGVFSTGDALQLSSVGEYGGRLELISEHTVSNVTNLDITTIKQSTYSIHSKSEMGVPHSTPAG